MAVRTATQSGNLKSPPYACGTAFADGDQLVNPSGSSYAVVIDAATVFGVSPPTRWPGSGGTGPTLAATGSGGSLPPGTYRCRLATAAGGVLSSWSLSASVTITSGQVVRVTIPANSTAPGTADWVVLLSQAGGGADSEKVYATGVSGGTNYDCSSASWTNGTTTYADAAGEPNGDAIRCLGGTVTRAAGVSITVKGDIVLANGHYTEAGSGTTTWDASASPSAAALYHGVRFGLASSQTGVWTISATAASPAVLTSHTGGPPPAFGPGMTFFDEGQCRVAWAGVQVGRVGTSTRHALDLYNTAGTTQALTDVKFLSTAGTVRYRGGTGSTTGPRWQETRVTYGQDEANCITTGGGRKVCARYLGGGDPGAGYRTCTRVAYTATAVPEFCANSAVWDRCYFHDAPEAASTVTVVSYGEVKDSFLRKRLVRTGLTNAIDTGTTNGHWRRNYYYLDWLNDPDAPADFNPHGYCHGTLVSGLDQEWDGGVHEYNGTNTNHTQADTGEVWKYGGAQSLATPPTVFVRRQLVVPATNNEVTGALFTVPGQAGTVKFVFEFNTGQPGIYGLVATWEVIETQAGRIVKYRSNFGYAVGTSGLGTNGRYHLSAQNGTTGLTADPAYAADITHNVGLNLQTTSRVGGHSWYDVVLTNPTTAGANDLNLGTGTLASVFADPTRNFPSWAVATLGATGTLTQKVAAGLAKLQAIGDTTNPLYDAAFDPSAATAPYTWVRGGWAPIHASLDPATNPAHDGTSTRGAIAYSASPPPAAAAMDLTGPSTGLVNTPSSNFTATPDGPYTGTFTPTTSGAGTFSPTSLTWSASSGGQTFTYTPTTTAGSPHSIGGTTSPTLTGPTALSYTVTSPPPPPPAAPAVGQANRFGVSCQLGL